MRKSLLLIAFFLTPALAFAQLTGVGSLIQAFGGIVQQLTIVASSIALLVFVWGIVKFIRASGDEEAVKEGKSIMVWGVIALFVMVSVWGIVAFFQANLNLPASNQMQLAPLPSGSN